LHHLSISRQTRDAVIIARMLEATPRAELRNLLIANRGEIAVRVIRAARQLGLRTVAVYSDGEQDALHVRLADDAWRLDSAAPIPYLDQDAILRVAAEAGADAIHPGYGFLAENAGFARACAGAGLVFVGPPPDAIAAMGDKIEARRLAATAGVPMVAGTDGPVNSAEAARAWADAHGYPVAVKASGGGGGRGFRVARSAAEMAEAFTGASGEAGRFFANPEVYLERYLDDPRHIEVQLMADSHGHVIAVGDRDCSIQRRHQKLIEEAPAPGIPAETRTAMAEAAVALARAVGYVSAGTVEFLLGADGTFAFLEMNTRIQVEHPVTEMTTGIDLVREQLLVAAGAPLSFGVDDVATSGHAIEVRLNAEDPGRNFTPAPGTITAFHAPAGMGVRVDSAAFSGAAIPPTYDSMIAKVVAWGRDRDEATARLIGALEELRVEGVPTTREFALNVLRHPAWSTAPPATTFLARWPEVIPPPAETSTTPSAESTTPETVVTEVNGRRFTVRVHGLPARSGATSSATTSRSRPNAPKSSRGGAGTSSPTLRSPLHGTLVRVLVAEGATITRGQPICIVEAMKMENDVVAHRDGTLDKLLATAGTTVSVGDALAEIV
jgi:acetyl-CoA/propionyl-CoA carboxylase biotin carboxyl carrier protein